MKTNYYAKHLSAIRLKKCYEIGSARIQQYLEAEIQFTLSHIHPNDYVLELGCGYGRILSRIAEKAEIAYGIDNSKNNIALAQSFLKKYDNARLFLMDARNLEFPDKTFDVVIGIQNAISALKIEPKLLIIEALRVTKENGLVILSSYAEHFWEERLQWFVDQSKAGLLGEIDWKKTGNGVIKCEGGFIATSFYQKDFAALLSEMSLNGEILVVDDSSVFCIIKKVNH